MTAQLPVIIQGGMGVAVSSWQLAREVSRAGQLGVISGTAMDSVLARRLQDGDEGGHMRRALAAFPSATMAARILERYYIEGGKAPDEPYRPVPKLTVDNSRAAQELGVVANFCEVWLAKEGHNGVVGINCLEKLQMATPSALLGAVLAEADYVLMGAGIPREIPRLLTDLTAGRVGSITADVSGGTGHWTIEIDPVALLGDDLPATLRRPSFLAIISADALAGYLARDESIRPDGFVVEGPRAGGHSAPPRGRLQLDPAGEPVYGPRDDVNLAKMVAVGLPFWLAGGYGTPDKVAEALASGAAGVQVGTLFAMARESGLTDANRRVVLERLREYDLQVRNDPRASPTGFPFKAAEVEGTIGHPQTYHDRPRLCDLSYLRSPYEKPDGTLGYRCASEPEHMYLKKGGNIEDTLDRKCLCNGLMATIGLGQTRKDGYCEADLITLGQDLDGAHDLISRFPDGWTAHQALSWLLGEATPQSAATGVDAVLGAEQVLPQHLPAERQLAVSSPSPCTAERR